MRWAAVAWLAVWVPAYASVWGWTNFLHLCDIAVILTCAGLWFGSPLLLSSQAVSSIVVDLVWDLDVGWRLLSGKHLVGGTEAQSDGEQERERHCDRSTSAENRRIDIAKGEHRPARAMRLSDTAGELADAS